MSASTAAAHQQQRPIMPRPAFPPTPAPSTDITGKTSSAAPDGALDASFALPPAAIANNRSSSLTDASASASASASSTASNASDTSYRPLSPPSPATTAKPAQATSRKRSSNGQPVVTSNDYSLPPPPTRSRKIIQMKPKDARDPSTMPAAAATATTSAVTTIANASPQVAAPKAGAAAGASGKKRQANGTTAAGRKIARKTAHSLIERRRRSKMNEEFGVLKDMIPACAGQEMHKLAILQASIEYMQYLQQCVDDLKTAHRSKRSSPTPSSPRKDGAAATRPSMQALDEHDDEDDEDEDEDAEMSDAVSPTQTLPPAAHPQQQHNYNFATPSPAIYPSDRSVYSTTTSPNLYPSDVRHQSITISPALHPSDPHHYALLTGAGGSSVRSTATSPSIHPSPAVGPFDPSQTQASAHSRSTSHGGPFQKPFSSARNSLSGPAASASMAAASFALTSPALGPQADREDHEATEALLMLNTDRRSWNHAGGAGGAGGSGKDSGRGMSVRDLLSH